MHFNQEERTWKKVQMKHIFILAGILIVLVMIFSRDASGSHSLVINELMLSNRVTITDEDGDYPDWIELHNTGNFALELEGYWLSDDPTNPLKWQFPAISIGPREYLLLFASGKDRGDAAAGYLHTNFRLSAGGETLLLSTADGHIIDSVETGPMPSNISYGRKPGAKDHWVYFYDATPGSSNRDEGFKELEYAREENSPVYINEFLTSGRTSIPDMDGDLSDWIEIVNSGDSPIDLAGYWLSDKDYNPYKWKFPSVILAPGEYLVVFASGKHRTDPGARSLHTNFKLNDTNDTLIFSTHEGSIIDEIKIRNMITNVSFGRDQEDRERWLYYPYPTPGQENHTQGFEELSGKELKTSYPLVINEAMAMNTQTIADDYGEYSDWLEIYNAGDTPVDLEGFGLSDKSQEPFRWTFPAVTIEPEEYLLVFASGKDEVSKKGVLHTNFSLRASGEEVILSAPTGERIDELAMGLLSPGISVGRHPQGEPGRFFFVAPSPGAPNAEDVFQAYAPEPAFSQHGGFYDAPLLVTLAPALPQSGAAIRFTIDGQEPTETSDLYKGAIPVDKTTVVRAKTFADGMLPSRTVNHTYLIQEETELAVISIFMDPKDLWDPRVGIYVKGYNASPDFPYVGANFWKDWEKPVHIQLFEPDGKMGFGMDAGIKIGGQYSRAMPQKIFNVFARNQYGYSVMEYPFFPDKPLTTYKALTLRTSGQDATLSKMRDAMQTSLLEDTTLDYQAYRPVAVYLNGQYWGLYNIRERINKYFIAYNHDVDPEKVDLLQANRTVRAGNAVHYVALREFVSKNDMRVAKNYDYVASQLDIENFMDYWIAQIYFANTDSANIRFWRERAEGAKWRWIPYDTDWGFFSLHHNTLASVTNPEGTGVARRLSTVMLVNLLKNESFKSEFMQRFAYHMNNTFTPERVLGVIDRMEAEIESEMPRHLQRWGGSMASWRNQVQRLRNFAIQRPAIVLRHFQAKFRLSNKEMEIFDARKG